MCYGVRGGGLEATIVIGAADRFGAGQSRSRGIARLRPLAVEHEQGAEQDRPGFVAHAGRYHLLRPVRQHVTRDARQHPDRLPARGCEIVEHQAVIIAGNVLAVSHVEVEVGHRSIYLRLPGPAATWIITTAQSQTSTTS